MKEAATQEQVRRLEEEIARMREKVRELEGRSAFNRSARRVEQDDELLRLLLLEQTLQGQRREQDNLDAYTAAWQSGFWSSFWSNMLRPAVQCRTTYIAGYARTTCN